MDLVRRIKLLGRSRPGLALALIFILAGGVALGLALFQYAGPVLEKSIVAVVASLFTYFLIQRDMRRRERTVDERLLVAAASMRRRVRKHLSESGHLQKRELEVIEAYSKCRSSRDKRTAFPITRASLGEWIGGHLQLVSYIKAAIHRVEQLRESAAGGSSLAGNASPKVGAAFVELAAKFERATRSPVWHMYRGVRGWERLLVILVAIPPDGDTREDISEAICAVASGLVEVYEELPRTAEEFLTEDIQTFQSQLPKWARTEFAGEMAARDEDENAAPAAEDVVSEEMRAPRRSLA